MSIRILVILMCLLCFVAYAQVPPASNLCINASEVGATATTINVDGQTYATWICAQSSPPIVTPITYAWKLVQAAAPAPLGQFINGAPVPINQTVIGTNGLGQFIASSASGTGTVTSVGLSLPANLFAVTGSPITGSGTLSAGYATGQTPNLILGTNGAGGVGLFTPSVLGFAPSATTDTTNASNIISGTLSVPRLPTGIPNANLANSTITINGTPIVLGGSGTVSGATAFNGLTSGTNTSMVAICGSGCTIAPSGTGAILATGISNGAALGTPASVTLTNAIGLPLTTGITGILPVGNGGTGTTTATGSAGSVVLSNSPTLVSPILGTPISVTLTNATGLPLGTGVTGNLPVANGGTGTNSATGSAGSVVLSNSPTLVNPSLGTPVSVVLTNATGLPLASGVTGTLPVSNGGTGNATFATYAILAGGSTSTGALQQVAGNGVSGQVLTSNGAGALPTWQSTASITPSFGAISAGTNNSATMIVGTGSSLSATGSGAITATAAANGANLGTPGTISLTNGTNLPLTTGVTGTLPVGNGGTGTNSSTGTGSVVLSTSPMLITPNLGTPSTLVLSNATNLQLTGIASLAADTVLMNASGASASPTAVSMPTTGTNGCAGANNALTYNTATHALGCNTSIAGGGVSTFSGDGTLITNSSSTGAVTATLGNAAANSFFGNNTGAAAAPGYRTIAASNLTNGTTGAGAIVLANSPILITPNLGTPSALILTSATGLPLGSGVTGTLPVANGGTGDTTFTPYAVIAGGTTGTGGLQQVASVGSTGQVLTSNGAGALPSFQTAGAGFANISTGTNTTSTMTVSTGASLTFSGTGVVNANQVNGGILPASATVLGSNASSQPIAATVSGTGNVVLSNSPTLVTPSLGTPTTIVLTNATGLPLSTGVTGTLAAANFPALSGDVTTTAGSLATTVTKVNGGAVPASVSVLASNGSSQLITATTTGSGAVVLASSPTLTTPALGTPSAAVLTNATGLPLATGVTGTLAAANFPILTGDTTTTGSTLVTITSRLNGTTIPTNAFGDQVILTTAGATGSWASIPACLDAGGNHLNYSTVAHAFTCGNTSSGGGGSTAFSNLTSGTNIAAAMLVGTGASLGVTGSGTISATSVPASGVTGTLGVANGGSGDNTLVTYALLAGGTTATGAMQQVSGTGASGQVLTSNGAGALPTWQAAGGGSSAFSALTTGTNTTATMTVSTGATLTLSGTGIINADQINGAVVPTSASLVSSNASNQLIAGTGHNVSTVLDCAAASASGTTYTCTTVPTFTPIVGDSVLFESDVPNTTTAATLNVNGAGAKGLKIAGSTTLYAGQILGTTFYIAVYDGTNWQLSGNASPTISGSGTLTFTAVPDGGCSADQTFTVTGAVSGQAMAFGAPPNIPAGAWLEWAVSAANTVSVRLCDLSGGGGIASYGPAVYSASSGAAGAASSSTAITSLVGDVTAVGPGSVTATVAKVNGVTYGSGPSTNTVPVVTAANTVTYEAVPNNALANSAITVTPGPGLTGGGSVSLGGTVTVNNAGGETVAFSATPTFSNTLGMSTITLTGNVTSFTLASGVEGQHKILLFIQGAGSYTVTAPANVIGLFTIGTNTGGRNLQEFVYSTVVGAWVAVGTGSINL